MTFRKRNRFCKSKLQEVDVTSNEEFDLLQYLVNERRDEIIKSLPEKPNIRWWTRLEIKIEEGFNKGIIPDIALALLIITLTSRIPMSFNELNYLENIISIFLFSVLLTLCITVVIKSVYKDIYSNLKSISFVKIKILFKDFLSLIKLLIIIFIVNTSILAFIRLFFEELHFLYQHLKMFDSNHIIKWLVISVHYVVKKNFGYAIAIVAISYHLIFYKILTNILKDILKSLNNKWIHYEPFIMLQYSYVLYSLFVIIQIATPETDSKTIDPGYLLVTILVYIYSSIDLIIANYKIDKKLIAEYEEKLRKLQEFKAKINIIEGSKY